MTQVPIIDFDKAVPETDNQVVLLIDTLSEVFAFVNLLLKDGFRVFWRETDTGPIEEIISSQLVEI